MMTTDYQETILGGRYRIEKPIGEGATATVYEAWDTQLQRRVAVKVLRPEVAQDPRVLAQFRHEGEVGAGLHHPHLAGVYDGGTQDGLPYLVMERVAGVPLQPGTPVPFTQIVEIGAQLASALAFVHQSGVLHCDLKPRNVLVDSFGKVKLVDFGVASPAGGADPPVPAGATLRLPVVNVSPDALPYLAPERLSGSPPTAASDVYGLGAVLYALLAGRPPYPGRTAAELVDGFRAGPPAPLAAFNPTIPPGLAAIVARALERDPSRRFLSAEQLQRALEDMNIESRRTTAAVPSQALGGLAAIPFLSPAPQPPAGPAIAPALPVHTPSAYRPGLQAPAAAIEGAGRSGKTPRWAVPFLAGLVLLGLLAIGVSTISRARAVSEPVAVLPSPSATSAPAVAGVPQLLGFTLEQARAAAEQGGWQLVEAPATYNGAVLPGLIIEQQPEAGAPLLPGSSLTVTASLGPAPPTAAPAPPAPQPPGAAPPPSNAPIKKGAAPKPQGGGKGKSEGHGKGDE